MSHCFTYTYLALKVVRKLISSGKRSPGAIPCNRLESRSKQHQELMAMLKVRNATQAGNPNPMRACSRVYMHTCCVRDPNMI